MWNLEKWYRQTGLQGRNRQMQRTNVWTPRGESGGGGGGMNWEIGIDMYTLICIKQISNKNLLYNINK